MTNFTRYLRALLLVAFSLNLFAASVHAEPMMSRPLVIGAAFHGANGVRIGPDGLLYISSAVGSRIDVLDPHSGKRLRSLGAAQGVLGADDLAFGADGLLYWTAFFTGEVMRMNAEGQAELVARVGPGVNAIAFSDTGRLFVTRVFLADELYEIDTSGAQPPRLVASGLGGLNAMDFGNDGALYGPLWFKGQVVRVDVDSGALSVIASGIDTPAAVKFSPAGVLHVVAQHQGEVLSVDVDSGETRVVARPGLGADNLDFDAEGRLYISNAHEGSVGRALPNGAMLALSPGGLSMAAGITTNATGELVVAAAQSLRRYDAQTGAELDVQHASIGDPRTVATPLTVSRMGDQLLVSSWFSNTVQLWDPMSGSVQASYRDFKVPLNAIAMNGDIIVAELASHRVVRRRAGSMETEELMAGILVPTGMAADDKQLFVADWVSGSIYQLIADGALLEFPKRIITGLKHPEGMTLDNQGRLLVVDTGSQRLLRIDPSAPQLEELATGLKVGLRGVPGYPPSWLMSSVTVDECGRITVSQDLDNGLLRVVPVVGGAGVCQ